jgi:hypothetical protein
VGREFLQSQVVRVASEVKEKDEERAWMRCCCQRKKNGWKRREERDRCFSIKIMHWVSTVFPNALGNTVRTQWRRLYIGLLLWGCFCGFFSFFPKHREGNAI